MTNVERRLMLEQGEDSVERHSEVLLELAEAFVEGRALTELAQRIGAAPAVVREERERICRDPGDQLRRVGRPEQAAAGRALGVAFDLEAVVLGEGGDRDPV